MIIYPAWKTQIMLLLTKEVTVPAKYTDFANVFLEKSAAILPEQTGINEHTNKLIEGKQPLYRLIYSLGLLKLEILKTYIKTNVANGFI